MPYCWPSYPLLPCGLAFLRGTGLEEGRLGPDRDGWSWALSISWPALQLPQGSEPRSGCCGPEWRRLPQANQGAARSPILVDLWVLPRGWGSQFPPLGAGHPETKGIVFDSGTEM